jgi:hypothetical protein
MVGNVGGQRQLVVAAHVIEDGCAHQATAVRWVAASERPPSGLPTGT